MVACAVLEAEFVSLLGEHYHFHVLVCQGSARPRGHGRINGVHCGVEVRAGHDGLTIGAGRRLVATSSVYDDDRAVARYGSLGRRNVFVALLENDAVHGTARPLVGRGAFLGRGIRRGSGTLLPGGRGLGGWSRFSSRSLLGQCGSQKNHHQETKNHSEWASRSASKS